MTKRPIDAKLLKVRVKRILGVLSKIFSRIVRKSKRFFYFFFIAFLTSFSKFSISPLRNRDPAKQSYVILNKTGTVYHMHCANVLVLIQYISILILAWDIPLSLLVHNLALPLGLLSLIFFRLLFWAILYKVYNR